MEFLVPVDIAVIGAGAAGMMAALAAAGAVAQDGVFRRPAPGRPRVVLLDGKPEPGRKVLISGGGRCNVTNARVTERDFVTGKPNVVRAALREFPPEAVRTFFAALDVHLVEEPLGKLFPAEGRARGVLQALFAALARAGVDRRFGTRVDRLVPVEGGWSLGEGLVCRRVIVATGGLSVPATGSTGFGLDVAAATGHRVLPPAPALAGLTGDGWPSLAGVTVPAILTVTDGDGRVLRRAGGSLLFTHAGVSGPVALDISGAVERALAEGVAFRVRADLWSLADPEGPFGRYLRDLKLPGACLADCPAAAEPAALERVLLAEAERAPRTPLGTLLLTRLPRRLVAALVHDPTTPLAQLTRDARRAAARAVTSLDLRVTGTEGYAKAEVTEGGVDLADLERRTLTSRRAPGLHFCGEVCDVTGRLGGFNFQWAWSSGYLAGRGAAAALREEGCTR